MAGHPTLLLAAVLVLHLCLWPSTSVAQLQVPSWVQNSLRAQTLLTADTDISQIPLCGANEVFNLLAFTPPKWRSVRPDIKAGSGSACIGGRCLVGTTEIHSQDLSVSELLTLGIRRLGLNMHFVPGLTGGGEEYRFCRGDDHFFLGCQALQNAIGFDICAIVFGIPTLTATTTGCSGSSATIQQGLKAISDWIAANETQLGYGIIVIDLSDYVTDSVNSSQFLRETATSHIRNVIETTISSRVLSVANLAHFRTTSSSGTTAWPSPKQIVDTYKKRVVIIVSEEDSVIAGDYVHAVPSPRSSVANSENSVNNFLASNPTAGTCPRSVAAFQPVYESRKLLLLNETNAGQFVQLVSTENGPQEVGAITATLAQRLLECGLSPSLDYISVSSIASSCIWTYSEGQMPSSSGQQVQFNAAQGWTTASDAGQAQLRKACQSVSDETAWTLSEAGDPCPASFRFAVPDSPQEVAALRLTLVQANVDSVLLPSNMPGVTSVQDDDSAKSSNAKTIGIAVGVSVGIVVPVVVILLVIVRQRKRVCAGDADTADTNPVVSQKDVADA
ncbi:uncharacterized protein LOC135814587 [Sycon ciliatum]|uniref:uncharacterized protein LOC135814587 n=1 Tax=Sycon ciliatum TaxID=27933 RepID=UPI0031F6E4A6